MKFEYITQNKERWEPLTGAPIYRAVEELCLFMSMEQAPHSIVVKLNDVNIQIRRNSQFFDIMEKYSMACEIERLKNEVTK